MSYQPPPLAQAPPPPWLRDANIIHEDVQPLNGGSTTTAQTFPSSSSSLPSSEEILRRAPMIHMALRVITICLCLLMAVTAVLGIEDISDVDTSGKIFVGTYMLFFSLLLLVFEVNEMRKVEAVDHFYRRNFGFIYSVLGKALFIIFIAFLSFGLGDPETLSIITGLSLAAFGGLQVGLYLKYPEMFELNASNNPHNNNSNNSSNL